MQRSRPRAIASSGAGSRIMRGSAGPTRRVCVGSVSVTWSLRAMCLTPLTLASLALATTGVCVCLCVCACLCVCVCGVEMQERIGVCVPLACIHCHTACIQPAYSLHASTTAYSLHASTACMHRRACVCGQSCTERGISRHTDSGPERERDARAHTQGVREQCAAGPGIRGHRHGRVVLGPQVVTFSNVSTFLWWLHCVNVVTTVLGTS